VAVLDVLRKATFGARVAEDEADKLGAYFVETDHWRRLFDDQVDIIYGPKGTGKSALYSLLIARVSELFDRRILLVPGENPRGATAFRNLVVDPPASEMEFIALWKMFFACLLADALENNGITNSHAQQMRKPLHEAGLLTSKSTLTQLLKLAIDYVKHNFQGIEGGVKLDPITQLPIGVTGRIIFNEPSLKQRQAGIMSVDTLISFGQDALSQEGYTVWFLLDRLDVAFTDSTELEYRALRALFRVYLDLKNHPNIKCKIFLRTDIWQRITKQGFREASHITREITLDWNRSSLLNMIIRRAAENPDLLAYFSTTKIDTLASATAQETLLSKMLPDQVDIGSNKPNTFDWMLSRTVDGTGKYAPRELIHLMESIRTNQIRELEMGKPEPDNGRLFSRNVFKEALPTVSKVRLEQTLYAEYPLLKPILEKLRGMKTNQTATTLKEIWERSIDEARTLATQLVEVGFFEQRGDRTNPQYWVPFLYRDALDLVQGGADDPTPPKHVNDGDTPVPV
jgi:hypothetical protein